ncbi:LysR family transcriptional regulator [Azospirillum sp. TSO22-1]|uniref:LysR family transcriptional regulator n=1 Tax=Azospirillum sp. TSO22-1 TaxID=716789 RepID=UPI000D61E90E|nr:LysR family transcriptional regulator [Azospirillum sp. TSO22-1]PWC44792.1 LysR family transcriptional regulator [Azospirillum sp. TSO22-1]
MLDWDDLRIVLAVARAGGIGGAAGTLGVNQSTVFRRLNALEESLGVRLFERLPGGYRATPAGEDMVGTAERMEEEVLSLARSLTGRDERLCGHLRVTASESLAHRPLVRHLAAFRAAHPGITLEVIVDNRTLALSRRESDIALRATRPAEGDLYGRKLADVAWTVYGAPAYLDRAGSPAAPEDLADHALVGWDAGSPPLKAAEWLRALAPDTAVVYRANSTLNQATACAAGLGLAVLPCFLGDAEPGLERVFAPIPALTRELWLVTHQDLKRTARVRAFLDVVGNGLARDRALFEGTGHRPLDRVDAGARRHT